MKSELFELFELLSSKEIKKLSAFINNPHQFKGRYRSELIRLIELLKKQQTDSGLDQVNPDEIFTQLFPGKEATDWHLYRIFSELSQAIRGFWVLEYLQSEDYSFEFQLHLAKILHEKRLDAKAILVVNQLLKDFDNLSVRHTEHYNWAFEASRLNYQISTHNGRKKDDFQIGSTLINLDKFYYFHKLNMLNHYLLMSKFLKLDYVLPGISLNREIVLDTSLLTEDAGLLVSYYIYQLLSAEQPTQSGFFSLLTLLAENENRLVEDHIKQYFSLMRNYCTSLILKGQYELFPVLHQINQDNLQKGYFFHNGRIPAGAYLNIANAALRSAQHAWANQFIDQYSTLIIGTNEIVTEVVSLSKAMYLYHIGEYEASLDILPDNSPDMDRVLTIKRLELKNYYELNSELLSFKLDSFKMYISRASKKNISESNREHHANFVNILIQVVHCRAGDAKQAERIKRRIEERSQIAEREWLLEITTRLMS